MNGSKQDRKQLLVIDDDESVRRLLTKGLRAAGFNVSTADDGVEAIDCLKKAVYDVIILDLAMPRVDGFAVLHYLRESNTSLLRRVIVLTGRDPEVVNGEPIFAAFRKPLATSRLIAAALQCCEKVNGSAPATSDVPERHPLSRILQRLMGRDEPERIRDAS